MNNTLKKGTRYLFLSPSVCLSLVHAINMAGKSALAILGRRKTDLRLLSIRGKKGLGMSQMKLQLAPIHMMWLLFSFLYANENSKTEAGFEYPSTSCYTPITSDSPVLCLAGYGCIPFLFLPDYVISLNLKLL